MVCRELRISTTTRPAKKAITSTPALRHSPRKTRSPKLGMLKGNQGAAGLLGAGASGGGPDAKAMKRSSKQSTPPACRSSLCSATVPEPQIAAHG